jgi:hypothetical protein
MLIPLVAFAVSIGAFTIQFLWSEGPLVAIAMAPAAASLGTAMLPLTTLSLRSAEASSRSHPHG